jgi:hypothetical protein
MPSVLLMTAAWVTAIFAAVEFGVLRQSIVIKGFCATPSFWAPGAMPPIASRGMGGKKPRSFAQAVAEVVFGILFLGWLLLVPTHPYLILGPGAYALRNSPFLLSPALMQFFWCVVALNVFQLGWKVADLGRGAWRVRSRAQHVVLSVLGLIPLGVLLFVPNHLWVVLRHPALDQAQYGAALDTINAVIYKTLLVLVAIVVLQLVWEIVRRSLEAYRMRLAAR